MNEENRSSLLVPWPSCITVSPRYIDLGAHPQGTAFVRTITIKNNGCLRPYIVYVDSTNKPAWITSVQPDSAEPNAGESVQVTIKGRFPPPAVPFDGLLVYRAYQVDGAVNISIHGLSLPLPKLQVSCGGQTPCRDIDLGKEPPLTPFGRTLAIKNIGGATLQGNVTGTTGIEIDPPGFSLPEGETESINLSGHFPSAIVPFSKTVTVTSNGGSQNVELHGEVIKASELEVSPLEINVGEAVAGTRFPSGISFTIKNVGGEILRGNVQSQVDWINISPQNFALGPGELTTINISGYYPPTNEQFPATIAITSNGGNQNVEVRGIVLRELYWGADSGTLSQLRKIPLNFYIGHLGTAGPDEKDDYPPTFDLNVLDDVGGHRFAYWTLVGPGVPGWGGPVPEEDKDNDVKLKEWGRKQALEAFLYRLGQEPWHSKISGNTLFVDIEHPDVSKLPPDEQKRELNKSWGAPGKLDDPGQLDEEQQGRNLKVLEGFLEALPEDKQHGVYAAPGTFSSIMGAHKIPHPVVVWIARWPDLDNHELDPLSGEFNPTAVVNLLDETLHNYAIGGQHPVIWQFFGTQGDVTEQNPTEFRPMPLESSTTFADVAADHWARAQIEQAYDRGIMSECGQALLRFCPEDLVPRQDVAVFLLKAKYGKEYQPPPATGTVFNDVPKEHPFANWIEKSKADGFTSGCSTDPPLYCPDQMLTRAETAVFLVRLSHGAAYTPPNPTGKVFQDVPATYWAAKWIEQLYRDGAATGCSTDPPLYCPEDPVKRAEMAAFVMKTIEQRPGCGGALQGLANLLVRVSSRSDQLSRQRK